MKIYTTLFVSLMCSACFAAQPKSTIEYTFIKDCSDTTGNDNAASVTMDCGKIGSYDVSLSIQEPSYFNIELNRQQKEISTDFTLVTEELPLEPGKAIEWHLVDGEPKFLIFRLSWGTEEQPFTMKPRMVVNWIDQKVICPIGLVDVSQTPNANEAARQMIKDNILIKACPSSW